MKKSAVILKDIKKANQAIKEAENLIKEIENREAIKAAINAGDMELYTELKKASEAREAEIINLSENIYITNVVIRILYDNYNAAAYAETCEAIKAVIIKYNGKPAGDKTTQKVRDELEKLTGRRVYIRKDEITIYDPDRPYNDGIRVTTSYDTPFLLDNKYNAGALEKMRIREKYIENPKKEAKKLIALYNKARAAFEAFEKARSEYNHEKPARLPEIPYNTTYMYKTINV